MSRKMEGVGWVQQGIVDKEELLDALLRFLSYMDEEVFAEQHSLEFNDAWSELCCLSEELDIEINGVVNE